MSILAGPISHRRPGSWGRRVITDQRPQAALFAVSCDELRKEIQRLTGKRVREAAVVVEPATGAVVHAFTSGTVVQIFQLEANGASTHVAAGTEGDSC